MWFGAHLPLIDFDGTGPPPLGRYVDAARGAGFTAIGANDHLVFARPWLDGLVALASIAERSDDMTLATTVALPVIRGPAAMAKAAAALQTLSGGRFVLGVGPGSSAADYAAAGIAFDERWPRFDESLRALTASLHRGEPMAGRFYNLPDLKPVPAQTVPLWVGSWGSAAGLRRAARYGNGWLASAYNASPEKITTGSELLHTALDSVGRRIDAFPIVLATMWMFVTQSSSVAQDRLHMLAQLLGRDPSALADLLLIGSAERCAATLDRYADAGVDGVFVWPIGDPIEQLAIFGSSVARNVRLHDGPALRDHRGKPT